jgi:hypothetical protein
MADLANTALFSTIMVLAVIVTICFVIALVATLIEFAQRMQQRRAAPGTQVVPANWVQKLLRTEQRTTRLLYIAGIVLIAITLVVYVARWIGTW